MSHPTATDTDHRIDAVEALAAYAHEAWSLWMRHLFSKASVEHPHGNADVVIPYEWAERWYRQMNTPYTELRETRQSGS